eukprot:5800063-Pyramimonas_sp.AAC.1
MGCSGVGFLHLLCVFSDGSRDRLRPRRGHFPAGGGPCNGRVQQVEHVERVLAQLLEQPRQLALHVSQLLAILALGHWDAQFQALQQHGTHDLLRVELPKHADDLERPRVQHVDCLERVQ